MLIVAIACFTVLFIDFLKFHVAEQSYIFRGIIDWSITSFKICGKINNSLRGKYYYLALQLQKSFKHSFDAIMVIHEAII